MIDLTATISMKIYRPCFLLALLLCACKPVASLSEVNASELESLIEFKKPIEVEGVAGTMKLRFRSFADGNLMLFVEDYIASNRAEKYYQRKQSLKIREADPAVVEMLELLRVELAESFPEKADAEWKNEPDIVVNLFGKLLVIENFEEAPTNVRRALSSVGALSMRLFEEYPHNVVDEGRWIESDMEDPMKVKMSEVLNDQPAFDGKRICIAGFLLCGGDEGVIYAENEVKLITPGQPAPFIEVYGLRELGFESVKSGRMVEVELAGTFYRGFWDSETQYAGQLKRITVKRKGEEIEANL